MRLKELNLASAERAMAAEGISVELGIASFNIISDLPKVVRNFYSLYANHKVLDCNRPVDFYVRVKSSSSLRKWLFPQVEFVCDQHKPFLPLPKSQAYPFLEWGMNWCIASYCHNYLLIHAAVLAKEDKAIIFPAPPGSGKSTLTSYLAHTGWRLLSDEMAVINTETLQVYPFIRPICVKNNSISLVKTWFPDAVVSDVARDTKKGDVAHVKPPMSSLTRMYEPATIQAVVFPKYNADVQLDIYQLDKCAAYMSLAGNAFNHNVLAKEGFLALTGIVEAANNYELAYSDMQAIVAFLNDEIRGLN